MIAKAGRQFDPDDPTSPMAKHSRELQKHQQTLSVTLETNHKELAAKVDTLATAVQVATASRLRDHLIYRPPEGVACTGSGRRRRASPDTAMQRGTMRPDGTEVIS